MVVPLILLGTFTKLAIACCATRRTRLWWLPGLTAVAIGIATVLVFPAGSPHAAGLGSIVLGGLALAATRPRGGLVPPR